MTKNITHQLLSRQRRALLLIVMVSPVLGSSSNISAGGFVITSPVVSKTSSPSPYPTSSPTHSPTHSPTQNPLPSPASDHDRLKKSAIRWFIIAFISLGCIVIFGIPLVFGINKLYKTLTLAPARNEHVEGSSNDVELR